MVCKYEDQDYDEEEDKKCEYLVKAFSPKVLIRQYKYANSAVRIITQMRKMMMSRKRRTLSRSLVPRSWSSNTTLLDVLIF